MVQDIIVDIGIIETRLAVVEDGQMVELHVERTIEQKMEGNIYRGKVKRVIPGMQSAFIDIGYERNAFLFIEDAIPKVTDLCDIENGHQYNIQDVVKEGQEITVQVAKEPAGQKGPRVTTQISLPGRYAVLLPQSTGVGVSKKIKDPEEKSRLRNIAEKIKPDKSGIIVRTAAGGKADEALESDIEFLLKLWDRIKINEQKGKVPRCIHEELCLIKRTIRDFFSVNTNRFVVNDRNTFNELSEFIDIIAPVLKYKLEYYSKEYDLFSFFHLESQVSEALARKIRLKSGGNIIIDRTEALTAVDVNTSKFTGSRNLETTILKTNMEAAREIARQLRLRDIGGIIIIDFIDMESEEHKGWVIKELSDCLSKDKTTTVIMGMTGLGLVEMTRKKVKQSIDSVLSTECPHCKGGGRIPCVSSITRKIEKQIKGNFTLMPDESVTVQVHPEVYKILTGPEKISIEKLEKTYKKKVILKTSSELWHDDIRINGS